MSGPSIPPPRAADRPYRVTFVCTGNICRSPMAEVVLRDLVTGPDRGDAALAGQVEVSSFGVGPWHVDEPMDPRAQAALSRRGRADHGHVARQIGAEHLAEVDLVLALDRRHADTLRTLDPEGLLAGRLFLLGELDPARGESRDIADPFYGEDADFDACLAAVEAACAGLAEALAAAVTTPPGPRTGERTPEGA